MKNEIKEYALSHKASTYIAKSSNKGLSFDLQTKVAAFDDGKAIIFSENQIHGAILSWMYILSERGDRQRQYGYLESGYIDRSGADGGSIAAVNRSVMPENINMLSAEQIRHAIGGNSVQIELSVDDLVEKNLIDALPETDKNLLSEAVEKIKKDFEKIKILSELFDISNANIDEESAAAIKYSCIVPATAWTRVLNAINAHQDFSINENSVAITSDLAGFRFNLIRSINEKGGTETND